MLDNTWAPYKIIARLAVLLNLEEKTNGKVAYYPNISL
jgi:hypothetical protein